MKRVSFPKQIPLLVLVLVSVPAWAAGIQVTGVRNFHQIDGHVYRGAQPSSEGWKSLAKLNVRTIIDLRREDEHSTATEARDVQAAGMRYVNVPMKGLVAPSDEQIAKILALLDSSDGPVFVHCRRGADRTGTVIACYRIAHDHWQNRKALREAKSTGMSWIELGMKRYILNFRGTSELAATASKESPSQAAEKGY
jgi:uncharacterized protein (TIGR01244 family)